MHVYEHTLLPKSSKVENDEGLIGQFITHFLVELSANVPVEQVSSQDLVVLSEKYLNGHLLTHRLFNRSIQLNFGSLKMHLSRHKRVSLSPNVRTGQDSSQVFVSFNPYNTLGVYGQETTHFFEVLSAYSIMILFTETV